MKQNILIAALLACSLSTFAYDFESNGIYYNFLGGDAVEVTYGSYDETTFEYNYNVNGEYSGSVTIPEMVEYNSTNYRITAISWCAFAYCSNLTKLTIGNNVTSIGGSAFFGCSNLTEVTIGKSVTSIDNYTFSSCSSLETIVVAKDHPIYHSAGNCLIETATQTLILGCKNSVIPTDGSVTHIGENAFYYCSGLTSITIPNNITSIGNNVFYCCSGLTSITIPNSITSIGNNVFYCCSGLTSITIPNSITSIGNNVFSRCSNLETITVETGNPIYHSAGNCLIKTATKTLVVGCQNSIIPTDGSVTHIGDYAFHWCDSLKIITIPESVTAIGDEAFNGCLRLTGITIGANVTTIGKRAFYDCCSFETVTWNAKNCSIPEIEPLLGDMDNVFGSNYMDSKLCNVIIGKNVEKVPTGLFANMIELGSITVEAGNSIYHSAGNCLIETASKVLIAGCQNSVIPTDNSVTKIGDHAFNGHWFLSTITIPNSVTSIGDYAFSGCYQLDSITIPNSVTTIGDYAFSGCYQLDSITIPNNVTTIGEYAFAWCNSLTEITIPNSVTTIGSYAFSGCASLTEITIPNSVTTIGSYAFSGCASLTEITIPNSVTYIGENAFSDCSSLGEITCLAITPPTTAYDSSPICDANVKVYVWAESIPQYQSAGGWRYCTILPIKKVNGMYYRFIDKETAAITYSGDTYLDDLDEYTDSITIPATIVLDKAYRIVAIDNYAFAACKHLQSVEIPASIVEIGESAFEDCRTLKSVTFAENSSVKTIGAWAFHNCYEITSITIPEGVTEIDDAAFFDCVALKNVTLPASLQTMGDKTFAGCAKLQKMTCLATVPPTIEANTFDEVSREIPVYVPDASLEAYKSDIYWKEFFNIQGVSGSTSGVETPYIASPDSIRKVFENGTIYILRNGEKYTVDGRKVE